MAKRRDQIRMTDDELRDFIAGRKSLQVCTLNADGTPHLTTLWFGIVDDEIVFETFTKSQKIVNLKRDPRIAVLLEDGVEYAELRGVSVNGTAFLIDDPEVVWKYAAAVMRRNHAGIPEEAIEKGARQLASKRTAVIVKPDKVVTWDHTKLAGGY
jgi:PPOX class probable F420-dependent enzyme